MQAQAGSVCAIAGVARDRLAGLASAGSAAAGLALLAAGSRALQALVACASSGTWAAVGHPAVAVSAAVAVGRVRLWLGSADGSWPMRRSDTCHVSVVPVAAFAAGRLSGVPSGHLDIGHQPGV